MSLLDGPYLRKYHALFPNTVIICLKQLLRDMVVRLLTDTVVRRRWNIGCDTAAVGKLEACGRPDYIFQVFVYNCALRSDHDYSPLLFSHHHLVRFLRLSWQWALGVWGDIKESRIIGCEPSSSHFPDFSIHKKALSSDTVDTVPQ